jgi:Arc/MetJ family transcription regulator
VITSRYRFHHPQPPAYGGPLALPHGHAEPSMIFKGVREGKPYPDHGLSYRDWSQIPPCQIRLDEMVTTTTVLALDRLLSEDSTFYGDLFPHAVKWKGTVYLEDGLHRAVRAALRNRTVLHARLLDLDAVTPQA